MKKNSASPVRLVCTSSGGRAALDVRVRVALIPVHPRDFAIRPGHGSASALAHSPGRLPVLLRYGARSAASCTLAISVPLPLVQTHPVHRTPFPVRRGQIIPPCGWPTRRDMNVNPRNSPNGVVMCHQHLGGSVERRPTLWTVDSISTNGPLGDPVTLKLVLA